MVQDPYEDLAVRAGENPSPETSWDDLQTNLPKPGESADSEHGLDLGDLPDAADSPDEEPEGLEDERTEVNQYGEGAQA